MGWLFIEGGILLDMIVQDWRQRTVSVYLLITLFICYLIQGTGELSSTTWLLNWGINLMLLSLQYALVVAYFFLKRREWSWLIDEYIGLGDMLFFIVLASSMHPFWFSWIYMGSLLFTLLGFGLYQLIFRKSMKFIPLLSGVGFFVLAACLLGEYQSINWYQPLFFTL
jgi:hypothetical protein